MTVALRPRPAVPTGTPANGGRPARRAVVRWARRLFRREWRQQLLVLALLTVAIAATTAGAAVATNTTAVPSTVITLPGSDAQLGADISALRERYGDLQVAEHQRVAVAGSVSTVDLRAQDATASGARATLRLLRGRYPTAAGEVAMTRHVAALFDLNVGDTWQAEDTAFRVVGLVENPHDLGDQFALVAAGQVARPATVTVVLAANPTRLAPLRVPSGSPLGIESVSPTAKAAAAAAVLALATIGLLFVGLVAVAGFTVMAQRHLRAMGMLQSLGATDRHVRLVMLANGAVVGAVSAVTGAAVGVAGWLVFAPRLETLAGHRIDRFDLPWWAIGMAMVLAVLTAVVAAWWPARSVARVPVVAALSGRPPRPRPAHRLAALGGILLAAGLGLLNLAHQDRAFYVVTGIVGTTVGLLLLAPLAVRVLGAVARVTPVAVRLALRDLARYQARSGAALGAITLAVGIAAAIAVSAAAVEGSANEATGGNLPSNELIAYAGGGPGALVPTLSSAQLGASQAQVDRIAAALHTQNVVELDVAIDPAGPGIAGFGPGGGQGGREPAQLVKLTPVAGGERLERSAALYIATPELLAHYGVDPARVDPTADILSSRRDLAGLQLGAGPRREVPNPKIQVVALPRYSSDPSALITAHAVATLGLERVPAAWLIHTSGPLTTAQSDEAQKLARTAGLSVETRPTEQSLVRLGNEVTAGGTLLALAVLGMTVGLIRAETANDLRTLSATGASSFTRRTLTGVTAAALGLLGALLGTAGAYAALVVWHRSDLHVLTHVPVVNLLAIVVALPAIAALGGWLLAGREPPAIARRPLE